MIQTAHLERTHWRVGSLTCLPLLALVKRLARMLRRMFWRAGMACALAAGAFFMLAATWAAMPVSTTHAIVGKHTFLQAACSPYHRLLHLRQWHHRLGVALQQHRTEVHESSGAESSLW